MDDMFEELALAGPDLHDVYQKMWDYVAGKEQNWGKWDDLMVKYKQDTL